MREWHHFECKAFANQYTAMKNLFLICVILLGVVSCKKDELKSAVMIRVENLTSTKIEDIRVTSYTEAAPYTLERNYGNLDPAHLSDYISHSIVRSTVDYKYRLSGIEEDVSAWCGTGASFLTDGRYTLQIKQDVYGNFYQEIKKDQ